MNAERRFPTGRISASIEDSCGCQQETANAYRADPPAGGCGLPEPLDKSAVASDILHTKCAGDDQSIDRFAGDAARYGQTATYASEALYMC